MTTYCLEASLAQEKTDMTVLKKTVGKAWHKLTDDQLVGMELPISRDDLLKDVDAFLSGADKLIAQNEVVKKSAFTAHKIAVEGSTEKFKVLVTQIKQTIEIVDRSKCITSASKKSKQDNSGYCIRKDRWGSEVATSIMFVRCLS